jgi:hypothetical protein
MRYQLYRSAAVFSPLFSIAPASQRSLSFLYVIGLWLLQRVRISHADVAPDCLHLCFRHASAAASRWSCCSTATARSSPIHDAPPQRAPRASARILAIVDYRGWLARESDEFPSLQGVITGTPTWFRQRVRTIAA